MWVIRTVTSNGWMEISQVYRGIHICLGQSSFRYSKNIELICFCLCKIYFVFNTSSIKASVSQARITSLRKVREYNTLHP